MSCPAGEIAGLGKAGHAWKKHGASLPQALEKGSPRLAVSHNSPSTTTTIILLRVGGFALREQNSGVGQTQFHALRGRAPNDAGARPSLEARESHSPVN
jgi:hypothetical protein